MRIYMTIAWILMGLFLMCVALMDFQDQHNRDHDRALDLLDLIQFIFGSVILLFAIKMIRDGSKSSFVLKISAWILIL